MVFLTVSILMMVGIVMIYSSSAVYAYSSLGDSLYFVKRHILFLMLGFMAAFFCMTRPLQAFRDHARTIMLIALFLLFIVLIPHIGFKTGGARRWIHFLGLGFQPSEFAKLAIIFYMSDFSVRKKNMITSLSRGFIPALFAIGFTAGLVLLEPDLGTTVAIGFIGFAILFIAGANIKHILFLISLAIPVLAAAIIAAPYRMKRIVAFISPWQDAAGSGFQLIQSFIALGSGGLLGVGLGCSKQKLFYLPQSHTDFIFSIIGEELGFLGAISVLALFFLLIWYSMKISLKLKDLFMSRVVMGISMMIAFETVINIGVSTGALPTKGLPLPFISYGGSSLVMHLAAIGIILNMSRSIEQ